MDDSDSRSGGSLEAIMGPVANTHVHLPPNFSAFRTPEQAASLAAAEGLAALGTSNYHDFHVYARFAAACRAAGVVPLFGLEVITLLDEELPGNGLINDPSNPGRMYLCGKALTAFDPPAPPAARRMAAMRTASDLRMSRMTELLAERFAAAGIGKGRTEDEIVAAVAERCGVPGEWVALQERHLALAFQELLFAEVPAPERPSAMERLIGAPAAVGVDDPVAVQETLRSNLLKAGGPAFVPEAAVTFEDGYRLVLELGGIPCYPILADGASPVCPFEEPPDALASRLLERGIYCAELIPARNDAAVVDRYVAELREAGIVMLAGTEHNTQRLIPMEPRARGGTPLSKRAHDAFWEGTCVVAGHQALVAAGRPGFVDGDGRRAAAFENDEARIAWFRRAGERAIEGRRRAEMSA